ncbi:uncharacterized protein PHALS_13454 [Plasmopara halstedii]|uniref:Uncharacterized protein n=1 Tax=Plasmopara halstedii TaxID=4781 RepID=A0A0P1APT9_PLAHL|nr:uncharacterized protein PHALS_13454 [Plasmopara halstedii]CEG43244.1 hypothetical protein PHALS_13454 [Plasmopara halstedii]|eukprot:XP_024579613.1 hypothetical protein PHALS_13454 [Plasmopara halstedii]
MTEFSAPPQVLLTASTDKFCFIQLRITSCKVEVSSHHDLAAITSLDVHAD